jgi:hypothetical protein
MRAEAKSTQTGHSRKTHRNLLGVRVCLFEPLGRILASDTASGEREGGWCEREGEVVCGREGGVV